MAQLGGHSIFLTAAMCGLGNREASPDIARTISRYVDAIVLRTFQHENVLEFARWSRMPVINGLSDYYHPCQALGDLLTIRECCGKLDGKTLVFVGDGNNVARSLAIACGKLDMRFILSAPPATASTSRFWKCISTHVHGELRRDRRPDRGGRRRRRHLYRCLGEHGPGRRRPSERRKQFRAVPGKRGADEAAPGGVK